ncbi:MAG: c-type cytochrome [Gammaproteobacteria bacterium]|nr:c-type cytochrome [Gammaproteobacteria bacterium]
MPQRHPSSRMLLPLLAAALLSCSDQHSRSDFAAYDFGMPEPPAAGSITPLPPPPPADPAKVRLGKALYNDTRLSADDSISCATCHDLGRGGDDGRRYSIGVGGAATAVNAPTVLNSSLNLAQFWDGRALTLEAQVAETVQNPTEMGGDWSVIERRLRDDESMVEQFARVYGTRPGRDEIIDATATYLRALVTPDSPFDRYLRGDAAAIGDGARRGYETFVDLGCISCHQGRNVGGNLFQRFGVMGDYFEDRGSLVAADYGRFNVTGREQDRFRFKVPSLRNVAATAPYFHDGSAATLDEAVRAMIRYQLGRPADDEQVERLGDFLRSLSGELDESLL